jgi:hypothetical protein
MTLTKLAVTSSLLFGILGLGAAELAQAEEFDPKKACRKAMGTHRILRAYVGGDGRLYCYFPAIEAGAVERYRSGNSRQNFGSRFNENRGKKKKR